MAVCTLNVHYIAGPTHSIYPVEFHIVIMKIKEVWEAWWIVDKMTESKSTADSRAINCHDAKILS